MISEISKVDAVDSGRSNSSNSLLDLWVVDRFREVLSLRSVAYLVRSSGILLQGGEKVGTSSNTEEGGCGEQDGCE
jgi:hypothetical protein